jgi:hypothetical protein
LCNENVNYTKHGGPLTQLTNFRTKKTMLVDYMMADTTNLSTIFGEPGEGIHKHFCGVAIADIAMTGAAAVVISRITNKSVFSIFAALIALSIGVHAAFSVPTVLNKRLGLVPNVNSQNRA